MFFRSLFLGILLTVFLSGTLETPKRLISEETKSGGETEEESFERMERTEFA